MSVGASVDFRFGGSSGGQRCIRGQFGPAAASRTSSAPLTGGRRLLNTFRRHCRPKTRDHWAHLVVASMQVNTLGHRVDWRKLEIFKVFLCPVDVWPAYRSWLWGDRFLGDSGASLQRTISLFFFQPSHMCGHSSTINCPGNSGLSYSETPFPCCWPICYFKGRSKQERDRCPRTESTNWTVSR